MSSQHNRRKELSSRNIAGRQKTTGRSPCGPILVLDDETSFLEFAMKILDDAGIESVPASTVDESIRLLQRKPEMSLVLCDLRMPERGGFEMLAYLANNLRFHRVQVMICSGYLDKNAVMRCMEYGVKEFLSKPVRPDVLLSRIQIILDAGRGTILLASADPLVLEVLGKTLLWEEYRLIQTLSGEDSIRIASERNLDVMICDLRLSDMSGLDLLVTMKESHPSMPVVLICRPKARVREQDLIAAGADGTLQMPFRNTEIVQSIEAIRLLRPSRVSSKTETIRQIVNLSQS